jgi:hypothetical protein
VFDVGCRVMLAYVGLLFAVGLREADGLLSTVGLREADGLLFVW